MASSDRMEHLSGLLDELEDLVEHPSFKQRAQACREELNRATDLTPAERTALRKRLDNIWDRHKTFLTERSHRSEATRNCYEGRLHGIDHSYDGAAFMQGFRNWERVGDKVRRARDELREIQLEIKSDPELTGPDRKALYNLADTVFHKINVSQEAAFEMHRERASDLYKECERTADSLKPGEARAVLKANQAEIRALFLRKSDREFYRDMLNQLWDRINARADALRQEWEERQNERLTRLRDVLEHKRDVLEKRRANRDRNYERLYATSNPEHEDRVQGWIDEDERIIQELEAAVDDIEGKIDEIERKLRE